MYVHNVTICKPLICCQSPGDHYFILFNFMIEIVQIFTSMKYYKASDKYQNTQQVLTQQHLVD